LETVNYIEHYALKRKKVSAHRFEDIQPKHSWNSNHRMGRWMLFELSRHSDHHHRPARKYQILEHHKDSPQMPSGYPGMMLISLIPPLFFAIIHPKLPNSGESTLSLNPS
jgi:alkane 1-monooxygenase